eukprot:SAG31_NODE_19813_length_591_cov_0.831301_1_plen_89_part_00
MALLGMLVPTYFNQTDFNHNSCSLRVLTGSHRAQGTETIPLFKADQKHTQTLNASVGWNLTQGSTPLGAVLCDSLLCVPPSTIRNNGA